MFASILRIVHLLISGATLYVVIMNNQKKGVDLTAGGALGGGKLISPPSEEPSQSAEAAEGENVMGSGLRMGHGMAPFRSSSNHLMPRKRLNAKLE